MTLQGKLYHNKLDAFNYMCQSDVKIKLRQEFSECIPRHQAKINQNYETCWNSINKGNGLSGSCRVLEYRHCALETLYACCPKACDIQDQILTVSPNHSEL
ncbi:hypothetical protein ACOMHN_045739 [Nucella lapillus]